MYNILYVDDEPELLEVCKIYLEDEGTFSVNTLRSAADALNHLKSASYDAIISDYQMPRMNGIEFLIRLRSGRNTTPFIIFTGKGREEVVIDALNNGADFYLQKGGDPTVQFAELSHKIRHAIQKRQADLAVLKSVREYRRLIESFREGIFVTQDGSVRMVNPKAIEVSGYSEQELLSLPPQIFAHPDDRDRILERYAGPARQTENPSEAYRFLRKNGEYIWVELTIVPIEWDGRPANLTFVTDVTGRKRAADALRESEERYRIIFQSIMDGVFVTSPEGRYLDFNDAAMKIMGARSRTEIFASDVFSAYTHPLERDRLLCRIRDDIPVRECPVRLRRLDGSVFPALITILPQKNSDGSVRAYIGTVRDLTAAGGAAQV